jgi:hypothetical protein
MLPTLHRGQDLSLPLAKDASPEVKGNSSPIVKFCCECNCDFSPTIAGSYVPIGILTMTDAFTFLSSCNLIRSEITGIFSETMFKYLDIGRDGSRMGVENQLISRGLRL